MKAKWLGVKKTPDKLIELIRSEVEKLGQNGFARATGLPLGSVQKYLKGSTEPTDPSLIKLADYFGVPVAELRGDVLGEYNLEFEEYRKSRQGIGSIIDDFTDRFEKALTADILGESDRERLQDMAFDAGFLLYSSEKLQVFFAEVASNKNAWNILKGLGKLVIEKYESMLAGCTPKERKRLMALRKAFEQHRRDVAPGFIYPDAIDSNND